MDCCAIYEKFFNKKEKKENENKNLKENVRPEIKKDRLPPSPDNFYGSRLVEWFSFYSNHLDFK